MFKPQSPIFFYYSVKITTKKLDGNTEFHVSMVTEICNDAGIKNSNYREKGIQKYVY